MKAKYNYELLELAREARKLTQKEVALRISFSQSRLSKAEVGKQTLTEENLIELSKVYDYPLSFFYTNTDSAPAGHLYFRRRVTTSAKIINSIVANTRIYKMALDELMSAIEMPDYDLSSYSTDIYTPEEIAQRVRLTLRITKGPVYDLTALLENHGIIVAKIDFGIDMEKFDGLSSVTDSGHKIIFLNSRMPNDRLRFSLAHELGHIVMHLDNLPTHSETIEEEADRFASEFLMPEKEIFSSLNNLNFSKLGDLKRYWLVSMRAIVRRAKTLGTITDQQYRNLQIDFSRKGYAKKEPINLPFENSSVIPDIIDLHKSELGYSDADIMDMVCLNENDYGRWFGKPRIISLNLGSHPRS